MTYSVIIPQRNSLHTLPRLFASIPEREDIEIILVDNTPVPVTKEEIGINREYILLWSAPERHAGGARNVGIENAHGEWLIFADADDYFTEDAFRIFDEHKSEEFDIIFYSSTGIYIDSGEYSDRCEPYPTMIKKYVNGEYENDIAFRVSYDVPWSKMLRKKIIDDNCIRFDEVKAANDVMFSLKSGIAAQNLVAYDNLVYICTVSKGSLTQRRNFDVTYSRFCVELRRSRFLKNNNLSQYQRSVMAYFLQSIKSKPLSFFKLCYDLLRYRQNIFIGCSNWIKTAWKQLIGRTENNKYIVR